MNEGRRRDRSIRMESKTAVICGLSFILCLMCMTAACAGQRGNTLSLSQEEPKIEQALPEPEELYAVMNFPQRIEKSEEEMLEETVEQYLAQMTTEEKAAQLFILLPEALVNGAGTVTAAGSVTQDAVNRIPVGGLIYMEGNLQSHEQVQTMLANVQSYSYERMRLPMFLCVDEEGGTVARIGKSGRFDVPVIEDMAVLGERQSTQEAYDAGVTIGTYLHDLGFNIDFAPVADVWSNPENTVVKKRSFGADADVVSSMALAVAQGLESQNIHATYKHFPGHGSTAADTHEGYAYTDKTLDELRACELIPFQEAVDHGAEIIMVGHISLPNVTGDNTPASLSQEIITDLLRTEMQYDGIVVTDALGMGAVVQQYSSADAAVQTILAGSDLILMPQNFQEAYQGILDAIENGTISQERLDESLRRILRMKIKIMDEADEEE